MPDAFSTTARVFSGLFYALAGGVCFFWILNRSLNQIMDSRHKRLMTVSWWLLATVGPGLLGFWLGFTPFALIPWFILVLALVAEWRLYFFRRRHRLEPELGDLSPIFAGPTPSTYDLHLRRIKLRLPGPPSWHLRVAHLSDLHLNSIFPKEYYLEVFNAVLKEKPDLIVVTGDLVSRLEHIEKMQPVLHKLRAPLGVWITLGNHDYWVGAAEIMEEVHRLGLRLLVNQSRRLLVKRGFFITLAGCDLPWNDVPLDFHKETLGWTLALSHSPDNIYRLNSLGADVVFSGHCHAGQIRLPLIGSLVVPSAYGRRFDHGHFKIGNTHLLVSEGTGAADPAFRINSKPGAYIVDIRGGLKNKKRP